MSKQIIIAVWECPRNEGTKSYRLGRVIDRWETGSPGEHEWVVCRITRRCDESGCWIEIYDEAGDLRVELPDNHSLKEFAPMAEEEIEWVPIRDEHGHAFPCPYCRPARGAFLLGNREGNRKCDTCGMFVETTRW